MTLNLMNAPLSLKLVRQNSVMKEPRSATGEERVKVNQLKATGKTYRINPRQESFSLDAPRKGLPSFQLNCRHPLP